MIKTMISNCSFSAAWKRLVCIVVIATTVSDATGFCTDATSTSNISCLNHGDGVNKTDMLVPVNPDKNTFFFYFDSEIAALEQKATAFHPFLASIRDSSISKEHFTAWFTQDFKFVAGFAKLASHVASRMQDLETTRLILGGVAALHDELTWFEESAALLNVEADYLHTVEPKHQNQEYIAFMQAMIDSETRPGILLITMWAIELVYQKAWSYVRESCPSWVKPFADRWGNMEYGEYVRALSNVARLEYDALPPADKVDARAAYTAVFQLEIGFWDMAVE